MKLKSALVTLVLAGATPWAFATDTWRFLPLFNDPKHKLEPSLALTVASVDPKDGTRATAWGLDFNFNCGLIQSPGDRIRTHMNLTRSAKDGVKVTGFELSPRYTLPLGGGLSVGAGPSVGVFKVDAGSVNKSLFGAGVAAGLNYRMGAFYAGADLRYHATQARSEVDFDHSTIGLKVGVNF